MKPRTLAALVVVVIIILFVLQLAGFSVLALASIIYITLFLLGVVRQKLKSCSQSVVDFVCMRVKTN